jgi:hypothetical protein
MWNRVEVAILPRPANLNLTGRWYGSLNQVPHERRSKVAESPTERWETI